MHRPGPHRTASRPPSALRAQDDLNNFMHQNNLPSEMQRRLREYFHQTKHLQMANAQRHLFHMMSPSLQGEVAWVANQRWLERIPFLKNCNPDFKVELAMALSAKVFAPGEVAPKGNLYVVHRGLALYGAKVLTAGRVWGDDVILLNASLQSPYCARAMNYLECYTISRDTIFEIAKDYEDARKEIRRCALFMALRRQLHLIRESKCTWTSFKKMSAQIGATSGLLEKLRKRTDEQQAVGSASGLSHILEKIKKTHDHHEEHRQRTQGLSKQIELIQREQRAQRETLDAILTLLRERQQQPPQYQPPLQPQYHGAETTTTMTTTTMVVTPSGMRGSCRNEPEAAPMADVAAAPPNRTMTAPVMARSYSDCGIGSSGRRRRHRGRTASSSGTDEKGDDDGSSFAV